jgi:hypothetical protein
MSEADDTLADELRALGRALAVPEGVDQRAAVRARLTRAERAPRRVRRWILAVAAALVGAVAVVAPARAAVVDAVGDLLRVAGIDVRAEPAPGDLPARPSPLPSVRIASLEDARKAALFEVRAPGTLGPPEQVLLADPDAGGAPRVVTLVYRGGSVRVDQFDGRVSPVFFKTAPAAEWVEIGPDPGIWLPGPHPVTYVDREGTERTGTGRLAAPTLIWSSGPVTYRIEGLATLEEAREAAASLR